MVGSFREAFLALGMFGEPLNAKRPWVFNGWIFPGSLSCTAVKRAAREPLNANHARNLSGNPFPERPNH